MPATAQDVREWHWSEGGLLPQDGMYLLRAEMSEDAFSEYVTELELEPYSPNGTYSYGFTPDWYLYSQLVDEPLDWWTPTRDDDGTYVYDADAWWIYAKYENGFIYVVTFNI